MPDDHADRPLLGKKIVVTRARTQAGKLAAALEALGAEVIEFPTIVIEPIEARFDMASLHEFDWVVFTSSNGVQYFADLLEAGGVPFDLQGAKVCAVGPATKAALEERGVAVDVVPEEFMAEGAISALEKTEVGVAGRRVLLPRGELARDTLPEGLRDLGAEVTEIVVYRTACPQVSEEAKDALVAAKPDIVTFTSGSTARHYAMILGAERVAALGGVVYASIGPTTTLAAEEAGLKIAIESMRHDVPGFVEALERYRERELR